MKALPLHSSALIAAAAAIALLLFAACSDKDEDSAPIPEPSPTTAQATPSTSTPKAVPTKQASPTKPAKSPTKPATSVTPPADGAISPLNPGSTSAVTMKANPSNFSGQALLTGVRVGAQDRGDRVVFEFEGTALPPGKVEYVDSVAQCGSGEPVQVKGDAILLVSFTQAAAHDDQGKSTFDELKVDGTGQVVQEIVRVCDFEGHLSWAIGVSGKNNFKLDSLQNPMRRMVDVLK